MPAESKIYTGFGTRNTARPRSGKTQGPAKQLTPHPPPADTRGGASSVRDLACVAISVLDLASGEVEQVSQCNTIILTEMWLNNTVTDNAIQVDGLTTFRGGQESCSHQ